MKTDESLETLRRALTQLKDTIDDKLTQTGTSIHTLIRYKHDDLFIYLNIQYSGENTPLKDCVIVFCETKVKCVQKSFHNFSDRQ